MIQKYEFNQRVLQNRVHLEDAHREAALREVLDQVVPDQEASSGDGDE